jgi:hypothetical protein
LLKELKELVSKLKKIINLESGGNKLETNLSNHTKNKF